MNLSYSVRAAYWLSLYIKTMKTRLEINARRGRYQTLTAFLAPGRN